MNNIDVCDTHFNSDVVFVLVIYFVEEWNRSFI